MSGRLRRVCGQRAGVGVREMRLGDGDDGFAGAEMREGRERGRGGEVEGCDAGGGVAGEQVGAGHAVHTFPTNFQVA